MATGAEVLNFLIPEGGWIINGNDFAGISYIEGSTKITKKQFDDGFAAFDAWKAQQNETKAATKAALLERLGITADEAALLLS
jgi:hypothetical protein